MGTIILGGNTAKKHKEDAADIAERLKEVLAESSDKARSVAVEVCTDILVAYQKEVNSKSLKKLKKLIKQKD